MRVFEASAPGRCGIVGNPSDIYGGWVVSCSIPLRARCRLTLGGDQQLPDDPTLWNAVAARFPIDGPVKVEWTTEIPRSSGLAGSTALLAATLACVLAARGEAHVLHAKTAIAELLRDIERYGAGIMCGYQDAYMAVYGGLQVMDFKGKHPADAGPGADINALESELPFLLITTGVERLSGSVHAPMVERWLAGDPEVVAAMACIGKEARQAAGYLLLGQLEQPPSGLDMWQRFAAAMTKNHHLIRDIGGSGPEVDALVSASIDSGALAAKLAGAGHGGTVIALTTEPNELEERLRTRGYTRFTRPVIAPGVMLETSDA